MDRFYRNLSASLGGGVCRPPLNPSGAAVFCGCGGFGSRTEPERTPNEPRMTLERIPNEPRTPLEQIPNGPRMDPARTPNGHRTDPERPRTEIRRQNFRNSVTEFSITRRKLWACPPAGSIMPNTGASRLVHVDTLSILP